MRYGAVTLFVDRAKSADTHFVLTDDSAPIVARDLPAARRHSAGDRAGCRTREGALDSPTSRSGSTNALRFSPGEAAAALPRQKTLTALIDWSYDLLAPQEQLLFTRLGVFAGGFGLDAATAVCGGEGCDEIEIFDLVTSLTDKSLVVTDTSGEQERYRLLESTAAYALEKLQRIGRVANALPAVTQSTFANRPKLPTNGLASVPRR